MSRYPRETLERLRETCANCGKPFGLHGAIHPHQCPGEFDAGKWTEGKTNFAPSHSQYKDEK